MTKAKAAGQLETLVAGLKTSTVTHTKKQLLALARELRGKKHEKIQKRKG